MAPLFFVLPPLYNVSLPLIRIQRPIFLGGIIGFLFRFNLLSHANDEYRFSNPFSDISRIVESDDKQLREIIQDLNNKFAEEMTSHGQRWKIGDAQLAVLSSPDRLGETQNSELMSRNELIQKIDQLSRSTRGRDFGSAANNHTIGVLFCEQSFKWAKLSERHIDAVSDAVKSFVEQSFSSLAGGRSLNAILLEVVDPAMEKMTLQAKEKLVEVLTPYTKLQPISYNRHFLRIMEEARAQGNFGSSEILECLSAYYEVSHNHKCRRLSKLLTETDLLGCIR